MKSLIARFLSMPRAARWLIIGTLAIAAYFAVVEPVLDATGSINAKAQGQLEKLAVAQRDSAAIAQAEGDVRLGVQRFGLVLMPGQPQERSQALSRCVNQVLQAHGVRDVVSTIKETALGSNTLVSTLGSDVRIDRLVAELQFEASPETVAAVVADLERAPEVASVSRFQIRKVAAASGAGNSKAAPSRLVKAVIAAEAWQSVRKGRSR